jgi:SDR family mycofactocin-dependent oxidoreductase
MGLLEGKVALISGAARGQGRSHAVRLAEEGADIIAVDICRDVETMPYPGATPADLAETAKLVEERDRRIVTVEADVRDAQAMRDAVTEGVTTLGGLDIVCANAGVLGSMPATEITDEQWDITIDTNLTGVWNTIRPALPILIDQGRGGSIIITSSTAGLKGLRNLSHYAAAKHGVVGLARSLAFELGEHWIRVNTVHPTAIRTAMVENESIFKKYRPDLENPQWDDVKHLFSGQNMLPVPTIEAVDISNAIVWLASDLARYVTAAAIPVDAGNTQRSA